MDRTMDSCRDFTAMLASSSPEPGGGGAAALVGALGAALGQMVVNLTIGKASYAAVEEDMRVLGAKCEALRVELLDLVAADGEAFTPLSKAYRLPKDDPNRAAIIENACLEASKVPTRILHACADTVALLPDIAEKGSRLMRSDAGCAAVLCAAAMKAALLNVRANTRLMKNTEVAEEIERDAFTTLERSLRIADAVFEATLQ